MESGRPPIDPDDLDFDFGVSREREGREERDPGAEEPSDEYAAGPSSDSEEDPFDSGARRARRRERPRWRLRLPSFQLPSRRGAGRRERAGAGAGGEDAGPAADAGAAASAAVEDERDTGERRLRDDPYTPAEVPVPGSRRSRHRDLPAKIRRRQAGLAGAVVLAVVVGLVLLVRAVFGGGGDDEDEPLPLKELVGQTIVGKLGKGDPDRELLRRVRKGQLGGVILTAPNEQTLAQQVDQLQQAAEDGDNPQLLVMVDQEGGDVKRLPGPPNLSPPEIGAAGADSASSEGEETGNYLKGFGVNVDLAPVLDVEVPQTADSIAERTFGEDAAAVGEVGAAFIEGMQGTGVAATAKHFPGLGPATVNTDDAPAEVVARQETLDAALQPFAAGIEAGVELVMVASASYPSYLPENAEDPGRPANAVTEITQNLLRDQLSFQGVIITDDLESGAIEALGDPATAGVAALRAGCDLILYAGSSGGSAQAFEAAVRAAKRDNLSRDQLQAAYDRITSLKSRLASAASD